MIFFFFLCKNRQTQPDLEGQTLGIKNQPSVEPGDFQWVTREHHFEQTFGAIMRWHKSDNQYLSREKKDDKHKWPPPRITQTEVGGGTVAGVLCSTFNSKINDFNLLSEIQKHASPILHVERVTLVSETCCA